MKILYAEMNEAIKYYEGGFGNFKNLAWWTAVG
jgi:hypothetical protein